MIKAKNFSKQFIFIINNVQMITKEKLEKKNLCMCVLSAYYVLSLVKLSQLKISNRIIFFVNSKYLNFFVNCT